MELKKKGSAIYRLGSRNTLECLYGDQNQEFMHVTSTRTFLTERITQSRETSRYLSASVLDPWC